MSSDLDGASAFLGGADPAVIEQIYAQYLKDPAAVDPSWRRIFEEEEGFGDGDGAVERAAEAPAQEDRAMGLPEPRPPSAPAAADVDPDAPVQAETIDSIRALMMIRAYRVRGHLIASLDPLRLDGERHHPELDPKSYGFSEVDYDRPIYVDGVLGLKRATLREVLAILKQTYCARVGVEFMHIQYPERKAWVQRMMEGERNRQSLSPGEKTEILRHLHEAEGFERFLDVKYAGAKRFSLEGSESVIPALEATIAQAAQQGVEEIVVGMAHRGRLNVLTSILGKSYAAVFSEFQGGVTSAGDVQGSGDVKYHLGASADRALGNGKTLHISLTPNPSHLEAVNPVVLGKVRAKQAMRGDKARERVMGLLIHGDASLAGQGTCSEVFELSELRGYRTGGTVHIVINNQIGFTTSPSQARTSPYPSEVAKIIQAPVFHVNGDDPEAVVRVCQIAADYRQQFKADVVVDIFCYRRHGHNEGDEPAFTQPAMYRAIRERPTTRQIYTERLVAEGVLTVKDADRMMEVFRARLETELEASKSYRPNKADWLEGDWADIQAAPRDERPGDTAVAHEVLAEIGQAIARVPDDFAVHPRIGRQLEEKRRAIEAGGPIDWATAEALALGSLLLEGKPVRLSGQDCSRGTFSQRHAGLVDQANEKRFIPLNNIRPGQARLKLADSLLSEAGVLGFEYGHSIADPNALAIWEAQFGDFANGAQAIIDQFVIAGETKWLRMSGLVMLLPHGFEGQGPEHSSARLERYLQLYADGNIQVVNCSTPASYFHVLRRQLRRSFRKPLIVMSPKSLLRHRRCVSALDEMSGGTRFHRVIGEADPAIAPERVRRVVFCSGKVYYDLVAAREERGIDDVALLRLEQIAPFPSRSFMVEVAKYREAEVVWCQEEPENMGAWTFVAPRIEAVLADLDGASRRARYVGRAAAASPASGFLVVHQREQRALIDDALGGKAGVVTIDITVPALGESVTEATVTRWNKAPGDAVVLDETLVELETDKIAVEVKAEAAGTLAEIAAVEGTDVEVGALLGRLAPGEAAAVVPELEPQASRMLLNVSPPPSPAVRRLLDEHGLDPTEIEGTGKGGRLLKSDVLAAVVARAASAATPTPGPDPESSPEAEAEAAPPAAPVPTRVTPAAAPVPAAVQPESAPSAASHRREERVPMSRLRRRAGERLKLAQDTAAMLTTFNEVDMTAVTALRAAHGEAFEQKHGVRLGLMSFFVHATVAALVEYPTVNAQIEGDEIVYKRYQDIGVAVSAPQGLVVPVLRDAGRMSFAEVEQAIRAFALKAREGKLALDDLLGGTFTISNGGVFGSLMSTPIINPPQSAILGMHKVQERPVAVAGAVEIRPMMYLALSYDHRLIDGREAVSFLVRIKDCIEDPQRIMLDL